MKHHTNLTLALRNILPVAEQARVHEGMDGRRAGVNAQSVKAVGVPHQVTNRDQINL